MINLDNVKDIVYKNKNIKKIEDSNGNTIGSINHYTMPTTGTKILNGEGTDDQSYSEGNLSFTDPVTNIIYNKKREGNSPGHAKYLDETNNQWVNVTWTASNYDGIGNDVFYHNNDMYAIAQGIVILKFDRTLNKGVNDNWDVTAMHMKPLYTIKSLKCIDGRYVMFYTFKPQDANSYAGEFNFTTKTVLNLDINNDPIFNGLTISAGTSVSSNEIIEMYGNLYYCLSKETRKGNASTRTWDLGIFGLYDNLSYDYHISNPMYVGTDGTTYFYSYDYSTLYYDKANNTGRSKAGTFENKGTSKGSSIRGDRVFGYPGGMYYSHGIYSNPQIYYMGTGKLS